MFPPCTSIQLTISLNKIKLQNQGDLLAQYSYKPQNKYQTVSRSSQEAKKKKLPSSQSAKRKKTILRNTGLTERTMMVLLKEAHGIYNKKKYFSFRKYPSQSVVIKKVKQWT